MKKLLPMLLILLLLLTGCSEPAEQQGPTEPVAPTEQQKGLYDPASTIEKATFGAVRAYPLAQTKYFTVKAMGNRLLLLAEDGAMEVLQGDTCVPAARLNTNADLRSGFDSDVQGAAYYLPEVRQVVLVNPQLQETGRVTLPEQMQGTPCISLIRNEIYYGVSGEVRAMNIQTGVSRLVRRHSYADQRLEGLYFEGELLQIRFLEADGTAGVTEYISTQTGRTMYDGQMQLDMLFTWQDGYVLTRMDGTVKQTIFGRRTEEARALYPAEESVTTALPLGGVIGYTPGSNPTFRYYNLETGKCTAQVTLYDADVPADILCTQDSVWILTTEGEQQILYRWQLDTQPVEDDTLYTGRLITAEAPDAEGLENCRLRAQEITDTYGISIRLWQDMLHSDLADGVSAVAEHQVPALEEMLDGIEDALTQFPEGFLQQTLEAGRIYIYLARSVSTGEMTAQYWQDGDCHIVIANRGSAYEGFCQGVAYAIDSHVLGNSRKFDDWNDLNPEGFFYSYSYGKRPDAETYLGGEYSAFLTERALAYPHDDRSSIFRAAMTPENAQVFDSEVMQAKLLQLCKGIREAYRLEKSVEVYPWEQYLKDSLAYKK